MKYLFSLLLSFFLSASLSAQETSQATVEYNGQKYPCTVIEYNLPPDETENVIKSKLKTEGYNADKSKGFLVYRNVKLKDLDPNEPQDVLIKVERKSRGEKDKSLVTLVTAKPGEIPEGKVKGAKVVADITSSANSTSFLNSFQSDVTMKSYDLAVAAQTDELAKAEKKLDNLRKEQTKIERKIKEYQDDLAANKKSQDSQVEEVAKQKKILQEKTAAKPVHP